VLKNKDIINRAEPVLDRPNMPGYGIQEIGDGSSLISWSRVSTLMSQARNYWISSTRPDGRPHATPVWGVWLEGIFYFGTGIQSQKERNIAKNRWLVVHLESGDEVVILEGQVELVNDARLFATIDKAYGLKYDWRPLEETDNDLPEVPFYGLRPQFAFAWLEEDFPHSATRYRFI
jgi:hypothetical protein